MGALKLPTSGRVYIDTTALIYTVERYPAYWPLLEPLWLAAQAGSCEIVSSELTIMETLAGPLKHGDAALELVFEQAFLATEMQLLPITRQILRVAARLRVTTKLKTPDAIHAATAQESSCTLFVTNDADFRGISNLPVVVLDDLLTP